MRLPRNIETDVIQSESDLPSCPVRSPAEIIFSLGYPRIGLLIKFQSDLIYSGLERPSTVSTIPATGAGRFDSIESQGEATRA